MTCPYLDYRREDDDHEFDHERPYCTAKGAFASPMRADVCNDRHGFEHHADCEIYRDEVAGVDAEVLEGESAEDGAVPVDPTD